MPRISASSWGQAKALVEILLAGGIVESGAIEDELQQIEDYLLAEPFEPFAIEMAFQKMPD